MILYIQYIIYWLFKHKICFNTSYECSVPLSVYQSLHLDPLLFLLFINDLPQLFNKPINILLYAHDAN